MTATSNLMAEDLDWELSKYQQSSEFWGRIVAITAIGLILVAGVLFVLIVLLVNSYRASPAHFTLTPQVVHELLGTTGASGALAILWRLLRRARYEQIEDWKRIGTYKRRQARARENSKKDT